MSRTSLDYYLEYYPCMVASLAEKVTRSHPESCKDPEWRNRVVLGLVCKLSRTGSLATIEKEAAESLFMLPVLPKMHGPHA